MSKKVQAEDCCWIWGIPYRKDDTWHKQFMEDLLLFVAKTYMPISIKEN
jgi:hypothetical protein